MYNINLYWNEYDRGRPIGSFSNLEAVVNNNWHLSYMYMFNKNKTALKLYEGGFQEKLQFILKQVLGVKFFLVNRLSENIIPWYRWIA